MDLEETGSGYFEWLHLDQDRVQCHALVNTVRNFGFHIKMRIFWLAERLSSYQEDLCFMELLTGREGIGCEDVYWINLAHDRVQWRFLVNMVMNLQVLWKAGIFLDI
jgi:hypothetical protein